MRYEPRKVFILEEGKYIESSYEEYQRIKQEDIDRQFVLVQGVLLELSKEKCDIMKKERERQRYLKKVIQNKEISYDAISRNDFNGEQILLDVKPETFEIVEKKIMVEKLHGALHTLTNDEQQLIQALYYDERSKHIYSCVWQSVIRH